MSMFGFQALTGDIDAYKTKNSRRMCFYAYPDGAATLTGIMSLTDAEDTDGPSFEWYEQRQKERTCLTTDFTTGTAGPWQNAAGAGGSSIAFTVGSTARLKVSSSETLLNWQTGEGVIVHRQRINGSDAYVDVSARITNVDTTNSVLTLYMDTAVTVDNTATTYSGVTVRSTGKAFAEGSGAPAGHRTLFPINPGNYTQIFKTTKSFSATALNQPLFYDKDGGWGKAMMDATRDHMISLENAFLFGRRSLETGNDSTTGDATATRRTGGILWFLEQYEAANGGTFLYRNGGAALTSNDDDEKRIITTASSRTISAALWEKLEERMFRRTLTGSGEKLVIGGHKALAAIKKKYRNGVTLNREFQEERKLSFSLETITTDYGTLHLKSHPRFNDDPTLKYDAAILDMNALRYRPMRGRDTSVRPNVQDKKTDGREDMILTEAGLELRFPESCMWLKGVETIAS